MSVYLKSNNVWKARSMSKRRKWENHFHCSRFLARFKDFCQEFIHLRYANFHSVGFIHLHDIHENFIHETEYSEFLIEFFEVLLLHC